MRSAAGRAGVTLGGRGRGFATAAGALGALPLAIAREHLVEHRAVERCADAHASHVEALQAAAIAHDERSPTLTTDATEGCNAAA